VELRQLGGDERGGVADAFADTLRVSTDGGVPGAV
jgi:hypothetical protein